MFGFTDNRAIITLFAFFTQPMRAFLRQTLASTIGSLFGLFLFSGISIVVAVGIVVGITSSISNEEPRTLSQRSILRLDLSQGISDFNPGVTIEDTVLGKPRRVVTLHDTTKAILAAAKDPQILAIYLDGSKEDGSGGTGGLATLKEVRSALLKFRASGKPIVAYDVDLTKRNYYLASVATELYVNPMGSVEMNGLRSEMMFFNDAFRRYGIGVDVVRVGKYKSFAEQWSRANFSPEARQETQELLNDVWQDYQRDISSSRGISVGDLQKIADTIGTLTPNEARSRKLIDKIAYQDEIISRLQEIGKGKLDDRSDEYPHIGIGDYVQIVRDREPDTDKSVAVVYAQGSIVQGTGGGDTIGGDTLAKQLRDLRLDPAVKAVVLRINSPGGSATASEIIQREAKLLHDVKPLIVSMGDVAASGGYWIATSADRIFAQPNTITGSIGVIGVNFNFQKIANTNGVTWDVVKTSRFADSLTFSRPKTREELAMSQRLVDNIYENFLDRVAAARNLPRQRVNDVAQGRVWSGIQAKNKGLVDAIGGLENAIETAADLAELKPGEWLVEEFPRSQTLTEQIAKRLAGESATLPSNNRDIISTQLANFRRELSDLEGYNDPRGIYARWPFRLNL
jgi:protease-4